MNGVSWCEAHARNKVPTLSQLDGQFQDSNYLKPENWGGGALRPGTVLECRGRMVREGISLETYFQILE